eukprot:TRINITY_DN25196_c0_g1_i1.p1 TRINITY_DN25196_c0_g1~~TRINITY_DN25196_c0_g1_i1.p1  ORF type:complete len:570 (+),score=119.81 TRINITY_DN25196_c0_g1_i1:98-1711(+)
MSDAAELPLPARGGGAAPAPAELPPAARGGGAAPAPDGGGGEGGADGASDRRGSAASSQGAAAAAVHPAPEATAGSARLVIRAAGGNWWGECGLPRDHAEILTPMYADGLQPPQGAEIAKICCGRDFRLMLTALGIVLHAGNAEDGHRGDPRGLRTPIHPELAPVPLPEPAVDIACGRDHAAAVLESGAVVTWGRGIAGALGRPREKGSAPRVVERVTGVERVFADAGYTFFLCSGQEVHACGMNTAGQLCLGDYRKAFAPLRAGPLCGRRIAQIQGGKEHCAMLEEDGSVWVWGKVYLTPGTEKKSCIPIRLDIGPARCIAAGMDRAGIEICAVEAASGRLQCWGREVVRQPDLGPAPVSAVVMGFRTLFVRYASGQWVALGKGSHGLPFGTRDMVTDPRPLTAAGLAPDCVPFTSPAARFVLYLQGSGAEGVLLRSTNGRALRTAVLRVGAAEVGPGQLDQPLSDLGVAAECVVQLLRLPAELGGGARGGALQVYVDATALGVGDHLCLELHSEATARELAVAAAEQLGRTQTGS